MRLPCSGVMALISFLTISALPLAAQDFDHDPSNSVSFAVGKSPEDPGLGDFDGDGELDVVVANTHFQLTPQGGSISVLFNNGDGSFERLRPVETVVGLRTEGVAAADFDGDGYADIAAASFISGEVSVLLSNGPSRSFDAPADYASNHPCRHVRAALINDDSDYDLMTANYDDDTLSVFLGNGDGTFALQSAVTIVGDAPESITFGHVNDDDFVDVLVPNARSDNVSVLHGLGNGEFVLGALVPTLDDEPRYVVAQDFNGDGRDDFITSHFRGNDTVKVFRNNGDGDSFTNVFTDSEVGLNAPIFQAAGDLNNDGFMDFAVAFFGQADNVVRFYAGDGGFDFDARQDISVGNRP